MRPAQPVFTQTELAGLRLYDRWARFRTAQITANDCEATLTRELLARSDTLLPDHPFLMLWEWEVSPGWSQGGKGDLVFTDGQGAFAVVETKWIGGGWGRNGRNSRRKRRRKVEEQAWTYGHAVCGLFKPPVPVLAYVYTSSGFFFDRIHLEARFRWTGDDVEAVELTDEERCGSPPPATDADA